MIALPYRFCTFVWARNEESITLSAIINIEEINPPIRASLNFGGRVGSHRITVAARMVIATRVTAGDRIEMALNVNCESTRELFIKLIKVS